MKVYPSIHALGRGFKTGGTDILEDISIYHLRDWRVNGVIEIDQDENDVVEEIETHSFEKTLRNFYEEESVCVDLIFDVIYI